jgi:hypothetical protein
MNKWHSVVMVMLAGLMALGSGCNWLMTPEERKGRETMEELFALNMPSEPLPPEDPDATYWFDDIGELTDEPVWQLEVVDPLPVKVAEISEIDIPNPDEWTIFFRNYHPIYLSEENGDLVLRGLHITHHPLLLGLASFDELDGMQSWVIGNENSDIYTIDIAHHGIGIVLGVNDPDVPGPEFLAYVKISPDIKDGLGRVTQSGDTELMLFDQSANYLTTIFFPDMRCRSTLNGFPIEFNDSYRIFLDSCASDKYSIEGPDSETIWVRDFYFLDVRGETEIYPDPRSGAADAPDQITTWVAATMEFFEISNNSPQNTQLTVYSEDMEIFTASPTEWPEFPEQDFYLCSPVNHPFKWQNDRYFVIEGRYLGRYSHPEAPRILWCVKYNEGADAMEPVWCRYEEDMPHVSTEVLILGSDARPYMVRFSNIVEKLKVIDLVSGHLVVDIELDLTNWDEDDTRPRQVIRLDEYNDIPVVVIFDKDAGHIVKIDLELDL